MRTILRHHGVAGLLLVLRAARAAQQRGLVPGQRHGLTMCQHKRHAQEKNSVKVPASRGVGGGFRKKAKCPHTTGVTSIRAFPYFCHPSGQNPLHLTSFALGKLPESLGMSIHQLAAGVR